MSKVRVRYREKRPKDFFNEQRAHKTQSVCYLSRLFKYFYYLLIFVVFLITEVTR